MLVLMVITREFMISGLRMMAATRGVVMAAERGGKVKTIIQLTALGFLLAEPMVARDLPRICPFPLDGVVVAGPLDRPRALLRVDVVHVLVDVELLPEIPARVV